MVNMTLAIPDDLDKLIRRHSEIKWTEVARRAIKEKATELELLETLAEKSKLTEKDVDELSKVIKHNLAKKVLREAK
ncbi:MAG: hypothetical protein AABX01_03080 [Candidatus Micrarchaeota archaeon]